ncbi:MAG: RpiB/LacA/LacB family sugar-phosphate isomerase, partial [Chloroflexi bacterium]|nr:RpiB/LacA/LacB family sugar-phosphate isomerase [Chloroflexota bacterium]
ALKDTVIRAVEESGHSPIDLGTDGPAPIDYADISTSVAGAVSVAVATRGILVCGSGIGASVAGNRFAGIRAALAHGSYSARHGVERGDMNVICLEARVIGAELAAHLIPEFMAARFTGLERHARRLAKLNRLDVMR